MKGPRGGLYGLLCVPAEGLREYMQKKNNIISTIKFKPGSLNDAMKKEHCDKKES